MTDQGLTVDEGSGRRAVDFATPVTILLGEAARSAAVSALADEDVADLGFVTNVTKLWSHDPALFDELFDVIGSSGEGAGLSDAERGIATIVTASLGGDAYCPLAWADKLAAATSPAVAASLLRGSEELLDERGRAIAAWARLIATAPGSATAADLERLLAAGFDRSQILRLTVFITLRTAFSTVNGVLGARPEQEYVERVHPSVREAWEEVFLS